MEIFLNNTEILKLDVDPIDAPFSFSVADMKNPEKRKSSVSKTITIKGTASNMRVLQVFYNLSAAQLDQSNLAFNFDPRQRIEARVDDNGVTVFDGLLQILKARIINRQYEFEAVLFSDMANIYTELDNIKIADLGWSEYSHELDKDIIRNAWDSTVIVNGSAVSNFTGGIPDGFGYIYSWFDLGFNYPAATATKQRTNQMITGVYFREVLQKIFEYLNIPYDFTLNDEEFFKRMVLFNKLGEQLSLSSDEISDREYESDFDWNVNQSTNKISTTQFSLFNNYTPVLQTVVTEQNNTALGENAVAINSNSTYSLSLSGDLELKFQALTPSDFTDTLYKNGKVIIRKNGSTIKEQSFLFPDITTLGTAATIENINIEGELLLQAGDTLDVSIDVEIGVTSNIPNASNPEIDIQSNSLTLLLEAQDEPLEDGDTVNIARFVADMKCSDFLRSLLRMFNLYQTDEDGVLTLTPASDYYGGTAPSQRDDWSEKIDYSEPIEIEPPNRIEGKFYNAKWVDEDDRYHQVYQQEAGERYGNYMYEISNTWQRGVNDLEVGFSQSVPVQINNTEQILPAIYQEIDGVVEPYKGNAPRLFFYNGLVEVPQSSAGSIHPSDPNEWGFPDLGGDPLFIVDGGSWYYPQFHHTLNLATDADFDLNFKLPLYRYYDGSLTVGVPTDNLFERYWRLFIEELTSADAKVLTAYFKLSKLDIKNLDFSRLKEIEGVLYRLNLVDNYVSTDNVSTQCELIKVLKGNSSRTLVIADGTVPHNPNNSTFMALVSQTGTDDPVADQIYTNTLGTTMIRRDVGLYNIEVQGVDLINDFTVVVSKYGRSMIDYSVEVISPTTVVINTYATGGGGAESDGVLSAYIEIRRRIATSRQTQPIIS